MEALLGGVGLVRCDHLDEAEATRLLGVGVTHDLALLDLAVLLKEARNLLLGQTGMNAGDEQVRSGVDGTIIITALAAAIVLGSAVVAIRLLDADRDEAKMS